MDPIAFETHPDRYCHWKLELPEGGSAVARLLLGVDEAHPLRAGYQLKLNSYDLAVDIELADAIQRLRFEHPEVRAVVIGSSRDRIFCAGANIHMLASSTHPFKVNFCKFTNETRLGLEDASESSGLKSIAACQGPTAGGGYELALACDEIVLIDDGSSTVSLPETPLLAVLPGTGGLTRVVDKRKVRRDLADVFATLAEGVKGKRALEWHLVDALAPRSRFHDVVLERARKHAAPAPARSGPGVPLEPLGAYQYVAVEADRKRRVATITLRAPDQAAFARNSSWWPVRAFRELDDALLKLRFNEEEIGLLVFKTRGDAAKVLAVDAELRARRDDWFVHETIQLMKGVLRRLDVTGRSLFAVLDPESCFAGSLLEIALACDRRYMLDDPKRPVTIQASTMNGGAFPMWNGITRLGSLCIEEELIGLERPLDASAADQAGLVTVLADAIDFEDTLRLAIEERVSISPDALTGMEASFRFVGPETLATKIFGRLSAWQNWIFSRPNAVGEKGALSLYGKPERPRFDWRRT